MSSFALAALITPAQAKALFEIKSTDVKLAFAQSDAQKAELAALFDRSHNNEPQRDHAVQTLVRSLFGGYVTFYYPPEYWGCVDVIYLRSQTAQSKSWRAKVRVHYVTCSAIDFVNNLKDLMSRVNVRLEDKGVLATVSYASVAAATARSKDPTTIPELTDQTRAELWFVELMNDPVKRHAVLSVLDSSPAGRALMRLTRTTPTQKALLTFRCVHAECGEMVTQRVDHVVDGQSQCLNCAGSNFERLTKQLVTQRMTGPDSDSIASVNSVLIRERNCTYASHDGTASAGRFDFVLRSVDGWEVFLEADGPQHFGPTDAFYNVRSPRDLMLVDIFKALHCLSLPNCWSLVRLPANCHHSKLDHGLWHRILDVALGKKDFAERDAVVHRCIFTADMSKSQIIEHHRQYVKYFGGAIPDAVASL